MLEIFKPYILTFIPIFVAVDAIGNIPVFISLVEAANKKQREKIIRASVTTATVLAILFMFIGKGVLRILGITISDFQIAGGGLLFIIAVRLLLPGAKQGFLTNGHDKDVGVFPLGTPLITGPAVLTTTLMMLDSFGIIPTFTALIINMFIAWLTLIRADLIMRLIGPGGTRAISKIMYILLAAIGVMMVRRGLMGVF
ncbi:MAG: MarC family protein [Candidatus Omnitrophica bacterium]|nr:MarC family protein [Candidatus Omnitrophota bacterium]MBI5144989.1 MarC family protein [Candidatus Omnitrophota bacterium]